MRAARKRRQTGQITEFATAFILLVIFFFLPLINLGFIPIRLALAHALSQQLVYRLACCERRSQAETMIGASSEWRNFLRLCGVDINETKFSLLCIAQNNDEHRLAVPSGATVPPDWLPNGSNGPLSYFVELKVKADIHPLFSSPALPGITGPVPMGFKVQAPWENYGRDPISKNFFMNI